MVSRRHTAATQYRRNSYRAVTVRIIVRYEHLEPEDTFLEETLSHEKDSVPT